MLSEYGADNESAEGVSVVASDARGCCCCRCLEFLGWYAHCPPEQPPDAMIGFLPPLFAPNIWPVALTRYATRSIISHNMFVCLFGYLLLSCCRLVSGGSWEGDYCIDCCCLALWSWSMREKRKERRRLSYNVLCCRSTCGNGKRNDFDGKKKQNEKQERKEPDMERIRFGIIRRGKILFTSSAIRD